MATDSRRPSPLSLSERETRILEARGGRNRVTLEVLGRSLGITRERVRQVQKKASRRLRESADFRSACEQAEAALGLGGYITLDHAVTCWRECTGEVGSRLADAAGPEILRELLTADVRRIEWGGAVLKNRELLEALQLIANVVSEEEQEHRSVSLSLIRRRLRNTKGLAAQMNEAWINGALEDFSDEFRSWHDEQMRTKRRQATAPNLAEEALEQAGEPLHWREVAKRANRLAAAYGRKALSAATVHNALTTDKSRFSYMGPGTYGLSEWQEPVPFLRAAIRQVLTEAQRPLTKEVVYGRVTRLRANAKENSVVMYLELNTEFYCSRSGLFGLREWLDPSPTISTDPDYVETPESRRVASSR